ncbi:MAG: putative glutamine amidotransferase [Anaerolineaceae bacterium]|nr:MAG: putative glutamine amidotransferase [Anaerolineaceae bacterium]
MSVPLIGLTTYNHQNQYGFPIAALMHKYIAAVDEAGGAPALIPSGLTGAARRSLLDRLDGILFTGGGDIAIQHFGGQAHEKIILVDEARDEIELALVRQAAAGGKPFLGICRGFQVVNVALGGTLFTHIADQFPNAIKHDYDSGTQREFLAHDVNVAGGTRLAEILGAAELPVNSLHHQGVDRIAPPLVASAHAPDGLVEGLELPGHPFGIAVQWHPEWLTAHEPARRLFAAFVAACEARSE